MNYDLVVSKKTGFCNDFFREDVGSIPIRIQRAMALNEYIFLTEHAHEKALI